MSDKLKPCPFCGSDDCYFCEYEAEEGRNVLIECDDCGLIVHLNQVMPPEEAKPLLLERWNRRAEVKGDA